MEIREITIKELNQDLFKVFIRYQQVKYCKRKIDGDFKIVLDEFTEEWNEEDYDKLIAELKRTVSSGGAVVGAFDKGLVGFYSIESKRFGSELQYLDLSNLYVSYGYRNKGLGKTLFFNAIKTAKKMNARKLYISAHSSVESQAFYQSVGCVEAKEYNAELVNKEPCDCQLEREL